MYLRPLTVCLVREGTLEDHVHPAHDAHHAIGALAAVLAVSIQHEIGEINTGLVGCS